MKKYSWLGVLAVIAFLGVIFQFASPNIYDPDGFYHIRHAWLYRTEGFLNSSFPWAQYSVINKYQADIWYGFHIFITPFTYFNNLTYGIKYGAIFITITALLIFFWAVKKLSIKKPIVWTLLFFFSVPDVHYRLLMLRPHALTLALSILIFYFAAQRKYTGVFITSALIAFMHLALSWIPFLVVAIISLTYLILDKLLEIKLILSNIIGLVIGLIIRPNFIGALKIAYTQVVQLAIEKFNNTPLRFGTELKPGNSPSVLSHEILPLAILLLLAIGIVVASRKKLNLMDLEKRIGIISGIVLSFIFGVLTIFVARRGMDLFSGFSLITLGLVLSNFDFFIYKKHLELFGAISLFFISATTYNTLYYSWQYIRQAPKPDTFKESALWLKTNSQPGEIVFNTHWDNFSALFFWNQNNYYINGMDPIFQYAFDKSLYLKQYFIDIDKIFMTNSEVYTCGGNPCASEDVISVYDALKKDFKVNYVFIEPKRNPKTYQYLKIDKRFKEVFSNNSESIFQIF